jgi:type IV pilus assembly protein PilC
MWFAKTRVGSNFILESVLQFPVIGDLVRETYTARASRTLSSLLTAGVPVLTALEITHNVVGAEAFSKVILQATEHVKKGEPLSKAFVDNSKYYPVLMGDMLAVGEETGKVAEMLKQVAEFYEETVSEKTKDLSTIIEPILMLIIGVFVGIFAVAMIAPIYQLSSAV